MTECDLQMVGDEFSRKPYALAVQQGSPLKDQLNDAYVKYLIYLKETLLYLISNLQYFETIKSEKAWGNEGKMVESKPEQKGK